MNQHYFKQFGFLHRPNFTSQPNLVMRPGIHLSLHPNCHHQIVRTVRTVTIKLSSRSINVFSKQCQTLIYLINLMLCKLNTIFQAIFVKFEYYRKISKKLSDPSISSKCYWTPLKILLNGRKIPCIPPLFHDSKYIADFK